MKYLPAQLLAFMQNKGTRRNLITLAKFWLLLSAIITVYSILFHVIMLVEGRDYSWITGIYWSLTVMSTLGFGDITFSTDLGLLFTLLVLLTGIVFMLVLLPFTFIQFFYAPWLEVQSKVRTPSELPKETRGHVIIAGLDPVTRKLIEQLDKRKLPYVTLAADQHSGAELYDAGYKVVVGPADDPETYRRLRVQNAAMVIATFGDLVNTNISFTVREITDKVPIVTNADKEHSLDILECSGNMRVFQFMKMLGNALAQRTIGGSNAVNIISSYDELLIGVSSAIGSPLAGNKLKDSNVRQKTGVTIVGVWEKGRLNMPFPDTIIESSTVLVLAGSALQLEKYDKIYGESARNIEKSAPVVILGGGRVGHAAAETLALRSIPYRIVEKRSHLVGGSENYIEGDAADLEILKKAEIDSARAVIITTHDDDMNIYLTFYCRQLKPDIQIISRATMERNVSKLHRAGADLVMSYASMGASAILNILLPGEIALFTEGLVVFSTIIPQKIVGKTIAECQIRERSGCSVVALKMGRQLQVGPEPGTVFPVDAELILVGTSESERKFLEIYEEARKNDREKHNR